MSNQEPNFNSDLRGVKSANTVRDLFTPYQDTVEDLMRTSFWLPTDAIASSSWRVFKIQVTTGREFHRLMMSSRAGGFASIHTDVDEDLVAAAHYVGISIRQRLPDGIYYMVAKVWYGIPKKVADLKLEDV